MKSIAFRPLGILVVLGGMLGFFVLYDLNDMTLDLVILGCVFTSQNDRTWGLVILGCVFASQDDRTWGLVILGRVSTSQNDNT